MPKFSFIIPVYNRPQEVKELLDSFLSIDGDDFEVLIVEDGSDKDCKVFVESFRSKFSVNYYYKENSGPGLSRNFGAREAQGDWFVFLDSDTLLPHNYLNAVKEELSNPEIQAFGGADRERDDFLPIQKAISYSMTSFLTTGGIRGSRTSIEKFKPRSFNMGIKREVFEELGGFGEMRYGEDIDFSLRIERSGFHTAYISGAYVYHKRRTTFRSFFNQVWHSGEARVMLSKKHPGSFKLVHLFPAAFVGGLCLSLVLLFFIKPIGVLGTFIFGIYSLAIWLHAMVHHRSLSIGFLSVIASYVQLFGYGLGFFRAGTISILRG